MDALYGILVFVIVDDDGDILNVDIFATQTQCLSTLESNWCIYLIN